MASTLSIANGLSLPLDAITQTFGCIGRKGAGKTYLAGVLAEQMLDARAQIIVLDPVGNWFGLRIGADGKSKGKDIFVIGGEHGDVPISVEAGARLAQVLVRKGVSAVLDISTFRQGERKRFAADFAEEFFHLKKAQRSAVHLFVEEAQLFVPQRSGPDEARMLGAYESIIRLGRNYGIGATLISQRPQSVNKEVLSQVECLCVLQVNGAHERKALEEWVQEAGADRKLVGELPGLARGEGFVWSPSWLRVFERVRFAKKTTFDASATPEVGKKVKSAMLSAVDVDTLRADLKEIVEKAQENDPVKLRKRIAELEKSLKSAVQPATPAAPDPRQIEALVIEEVNRQLARVRDRIVEDVIRDDDLWALKALSIDGGKSVKLIKSAPAAATPAPPAAAPSPKQKIAKSDGMALSGPEQRILNAIAWFETIGVQEANQPSVAFLSGYSFTSSSFANARAMLRAKGLAEYLPGDLIRLTDEGRAHAEFDTAPRSNETLHSAVFAKLPGPERRLLEPLLRAWPGSLSAEHLAERSGYSLTSSSFANARGSLKGFGLVEYPGPGLVRAKDLLFPEGA